MKLYRVTQDDTILWYGFNLDQATIEFKKYIDLGLDVMLETLSHKGI